MAAENYIYGRNAVTEALQNDAKIEKVFVSFNSQGSAINKIYTIAKDTGIKIVKHDQRKFKALEKKLGIFERDSQGVIALKEMISYQNDYEMLNEALEAEDNPVIVVVDGIEDPHNLGAIARSVEGSGAYGLIMNERHSAPITPASVKTSAGALQILPVAKTHNLSQALKYAKGLGYSVIGTDMKAEHNYSDSIYDKPILLIIGSEGKGMRQATKNVCDSIIEIPIKGKIESLNASVSAGIVLFEIARQKSLA